MAQTGSNLFYRDYYLQVMYGMVVVIFVALILASVVMYQVSHRPLPEFSAESPDHKTIPLIAYTEPNLMPDTLVRWASKAAVAAYTFNFVDHDKQIALARDYFTPGGWDAYQSAINATVARVVKQQLFVYGVVREPPVISNQGDRPGHPYSWRVQVPFLATYQSAEESTSSDYYILMTIVKVPTTINPDAIGIETFEMRDAHG